MSLRTLVIGTALLALPAAALAQSGTATASSSATVADATPKVHPRVGNETELGRKYTGWFFAEQNDSLWAHMSQDMRDDLGEPGTIGEHRNEILSRAGDEVEVLNEMVMMRNGLPQYWRTSKYSMMAEPLMLRWVIVDGEIWGVGVNPASQAPPTDPEQ